MFNSHITSFRESVAIVTRILSKNKITVRHEGMKAYVSYDKNGAPVSVTLPEIPDTASPELLFAIRGFIDHEVGHLLHTDSKVISKILAPLSKKMAKRMMNLWNIVEDVFVEKEQRLAFKGAGRNLDQLLDYVKSQMLDKAYLVNLQTMNDDQMMMGMLPAAIRAASGADMSMVEFMKDKWHHMERIKPFLDSIAGELRDIKSSSHSYEIAKRLYDALSEAGEEQGEEESGESGQKSKDKGEEKSEDKSQDKSEEKGGRGKRAPEEDEQEREQDEQSGQDEEAGDESEGESEDDSDSDKDEGNSEPTESNDEGEGEGEDSGDGSGQDSDEDEDEDEDDDSADSKSNGGDGEDSDGDSDAERQPKQPSTGSAEPTDSHLSDCEMDDLDSLSSRLIESMTAELRSDLESYTPFTREMDYVGPIDQRLIDKAAQSRGAFPPRVETYTYQTAIKNSHVLQAEVERAFKAQAAARWEGGKRKGHINRSSLHKIRSGDDRVFKTRQVTETKSVAVQLVVDCSGSMFDRRVGSGSKIENACASAYMLARVLDRLSVPLEIIAFSTTDQLGISSGASSYQGLQEQLQRCANECYAEGVYDQFDRWWPLATYIVKDFNKRFTQESQDHLIYLPRLTEIAGGNGDGEQVLIAAERLIKRSEARKVMIVMSDGEPSAGQNDAKDAALLLRTVKAIEKANIEIYGVGLQDSSVTQFYKKNVVIHNSNDVAPKILEIVRQILLSK